MEATKVIAEFTCKYQFRLTVAVKVNGLDIPFVKSIMSLRAHDITI